MEDWTLCIIVDGVPTLFQVNGWPFPDMEDYRPVLRRFGIQPLRSAVVMERWRLDDGSWRHRPLCGCVIPEAATHD